jgi:putative transposase
MKFTFIKNNRKYYSIGKMAKVLGVSRSGYYDWLSRPESKRSLENKKILEKIKEIHKNSREIYGSPKIYKELQNQEIKCGINRVARIMQENNIRSKTRKKFRITTNSAHKNPIAENILNRNFYADTPNKVWVSDITYIHTKEGWYYLCVIIDLFSRKIIGWCMDSGITNSIVIKAFIMAYTNRKPGKNVIFHSDRGVQYTSKDFQKLLKKKGFQCSMSRKGNCWDNACAETFFRSLKVEEVYHNKYYSRKMARRSIFEYIEVFYNRKRIHSYLKNMSPAEFERKKCA